MLTERAASKSSLYHSLIMHYFSSTVRTIR